MSASTSSLRTRSRRFENYIDELAAGRTPQVRETTKSIPPGVLIKKPT